jgi:hypothetical protein
MPIILSRAVDLNFDPVVKQEGVSALYRKGEGGVLLVPVFAAAVLHYQQAFLELRGLGNQSDVLFKNSHRFYVLGQLDHLAREG